jgi:GNAT superfamily N-acetyltransferase
MRIVDLEAGHLDAARRLAAEAYAEERQAVPALPAVAEIPGLSDVLKNGLAVAALEGDELIGFLGCSSPWEGAFGQVRGTFSPIHAHATVPQDRARIYDRLYQAASAKWVANGALSHAVGLYAHDPAALGSFFDNGFGIRTIDAVRDVSPIEVPGLEGVTIRQLVAADAEAIAPLHEGLITHLRQPPMFMPLTVAASPEVMAGWIDEGRYLFVAAFDDERPIAYLRWEASGENFACDDPAMMSITGAYALPEVRGTGVATALLAWLIDWLREHGYERCGVDFESFNYTARRFWLKHFTAYTMGVVRRIDERIVES